MLSVRAAAQVGSKFGDDGARRLYPEYHALVTAMRLQQRASASSAAAAAATAATAATGPVSLLGGSYATLAGAELRRVHGICDAVSDVASTSLIETWIDETETRTWILFETSRGNNLM